MHRRWICNDVWMDILPSFDHAQLGLKMALLSPRFDVLVDKHFDGKSELKIWRAIVICKDSVAAVPKLSVFIDANFKEFPLPDHSLPNKIRFKLLEIKYIDHYVIEFLHGNQQIFDKGINLRLDVTSSLTTDDNQPIWDVFVRQIWPFFAQNTRHLQFYDAAHLDNLRRLISPTILTDLHQLNSIISYWLFPDAIADDGPSATSPAAGKALSKWLHTPTTDGQPKRLRCINYLNPTNAEWINNFKKKFLSATTCVSYKIQLAVDESKTPIVPFELVNGQNKEKLTLIKANETDWGNQWIMKRCKTGETTAAVQWEDENLNDVNIHLDDVECIGPLSLPEEKAGQSNEKGVSSDK